MNIKLEALLRVCEPERKRGGIVGILYTAIKINNQLFLDVNKRHITVDGEKFCVLFRADEEEQYNSVRELIQDTL